MIRILLLLLIVYLIGNWNGFWAGRRYESDAIRMTSRWILYDWKDYTHGRNN